MDCRREGSESLHEDEQGEEEEGAFSPEASEAETQEREEGKDLKTEKIAYQGKGRWAWLGARFLRIHKQ